jgi:DNA repair protein RadC
VRRTKAARYASRHEHSLDLTLPLEAHAMSKQSRKQLILNESTGQYTARGPVSADTIIATAKSILAARVNRPVALTNPKEVSNYLITQFAELEHEVFGCLFMDQRHRLIEFKTLFAGTIDGCAVHPREVVKTALQLNAAALILAHNHPSGIGEPSGADQTLTARLKEALALVDVRVLDHVIVAGATTVSFATRGLI